MRAGTGPLKEENMKKLVLATAAVAALAISAPTFTAPAFAQDVKVKVKSGDRHDGMRHRDVKKVVIKHDRGRHHGFSHSRHYGYGGVKKKVIIKHGHGGGKTVIKKKFEG
jgi:Ni/Co efflux regulator RcnB